jgi:hypothetical protein
METPQFGCDCMEFTQFAPQSQWRVWRRVVSVFDRVRPTALSMATDFSPILRKRGSAA